jgi:hypothetical protein
MAARVTALSEKTGLPLKHILRECCVHWSTFARWRLGQTEPRAGTESSVCGILFKIEQRHDAKARR